MDRDRRARERLLERLDAYYDAVPRPNADVEDLGAFILFVARSGWPYYARPHRSYAGPPATTKDVLAVRERQRAVAVPEAIEWVAEVTPGLIEPVTAAGLTVLRAPLQVLGTQRPVASPDGIVVRLVDPDDPDLLKINTAVHLGFGTPGTAIGTVGTADRDAGATAADPTSVGHLRDRLRAGRTVMAVAGDKDGPLAAGSHQPVGGVTEIVGVATLPSARRRGLGAAVTAALVADAQDRGIETIFLSAGSADVARVYEQVGFRRVGTACIASVD